MEIIVGKLAGFCGGVKRSILISEDTLKNNDNVYCFGELVHNARVISDLESKGLKFISDINEVPLGSKVILRAHGVEKKIYEIAKKRKLDLVDLTCPNVLRIHDEAERLAREGNFMILIAQKSHPESIGTISFCGEDSYVLEDENEIEELISKIEKSGKKKVAVVTQTTISVDKYNKLVNILKDKLFDYELDIKNNICDATELRQKEMKDLSSSVDLVIVIGGKNSSNTKKLYDIGAEHGNECIMIETVDELNGDYSKYKKIGIMAGASTPQSSIDDVVKYLERI